MRPIWRAEEHILLHFPLNIKLNFSERLRLIALIWLDKHFRVARFISEKRRIRLDTPYIRYFSVLHFSPSFFFTLWLTLAILKLPKKGIGMCVISSNSSAVCFRWVATQCLSIEAFRRIRLDVADGCFEARAQSYPMPWLAALVSGALKVNYVRDIIRICMHNTPEPTHPLQTVWESKDRS